MSNDSRKLESHDFANCADCIEATSRQLLAFVEKWPMDRTKHVVLHGRLRGLHGFSILAIKLPDYQEWMSRSVFIGGGMTIAQSRQLARALLSHEEGSK